MKQIGFTNFRKFQEFPTIDLGDITILVGGNNAGKSTVVKAMLLALDNLKMMEVRRDKEGNIRPIFRFDLPDSHNVHVGDFSRALCRNWKGRAEILFHVNVYGTEFDITITDFMGSTETFASVTELVVYGQNDEMFVFDFENQMFFATLKPSSRAKDDAAELDFQIAELTKRLNEGVDGYNPSFSDLEQMIKAKAAVTNMEKQLKALKAKRKSLSKALIESIETPLSNIVGEKVNGPLVPALMMGMEAYTQSPVLVKDKRSQEYKQEKENKTILAESSFIAQGDYEDVIYDINQKHIEYVPAHAATQSVIYLCDDRNNYMAKTVAEFHKERIQRGDLEYEFVKRWMQEFSIGDDFVIESLGGEAYRVYIIEKEKKTFLSDKGMGSIQIMALLLRLASIIRKENNNEIPPLVIIEEPEQNLHPDYQTKLLDLFMDALKYEIQFVIETHSEYLVRNTQIAVNKQNLMKDDLGLVPFKVWFFPQDEPPYPMLYRTDGKFSNEFGTGFFDQANKLIYQIL